MKLYWVTIEHRFSAEVEADDSTRAEEKAREYIAHNLDDCLDLESTRASSSAMPTTSLLCSRIAGLIVSCSWSEACPRIT
jgi:hypothetical protein